MRHRPKPQNFDKFYYRYVAKGEACGCAERIIDVAEFERLAGRPRLRRDGGRSWLRDAFRFFRQRA